MFGFLHFLQWGVEMCVMFLMLTSHLRNTLSSVSYSQRPYLTGYTLLMTLKSREGESMQNC